MNKRNRYRIIADSLFAVVQASLFTLIPTLVDSAGINIILIFTVILLSIAYYSFLREAIIDKIIILRGIDLHDVEDNEQLPQHSLFPMEAIEKLYYKSATAKCEKGYLSCIQHYMIVFEWERIASFISNRYLDGAKEGIKNISNGKLGGCYENTMTIEILYASVCVMLEIINENESFSNWIHEGQDTIRLKKELEMIQKQCNSHSTM